MALCPKCNQELEGAYCSNCGEMVFNINTTNRKAEEKKKAKAKKIVSSIILSLIFAIILLCVTVFIFRAAMAKFAV